MLEKILSFLDSSLNNFLIKNVDIMPIRFVKLIAFYYTNALIRKIYLKKLGFITGENSYTNLGLLFTPNDDLSPSVIIGKNVSIAPNVTFITNSEPNNSDYLKNNLYVKENLIKKDCKIYIEDDVWIGAGCIILPGITLKKGSIIGAGAVVTKDAEEYSIYTGIPARKTRKI